MVLCKINKFSFQKQIEYNDFGDKRKVICIPNFMDVMSNLFFVIFGMYYYYKYKDIYLTTGFILTCIGSMYYHIDPNMNTLLYDRLPMSFVFSMILARKLELNLLYTTICIAYNILTVLYWYSTYNLSYYIASQLSLIIFFLLYDYGLRTCILIYILAKITETYDKQIYKLTNNLISGHTMKHILAAIAILFI